MKIAWKDEYSVGIKEIDDQHKFFIDLLNELVSTIKKNPSPEKFRTCFQPLAEYAEKHFSTEEEYFKKYSFEGAEEHKQKHDEMRQDIKDIQEMKDSRQTDFYDSVVFFLTEWLEDHLEKADQEYKEKFKKG